MSACIHEVFYCTRCDTQATEQTCPHERSIELIYREPGSGNAALRRAAAEGDRPTGIRTNRDARRPAEGRR